MTHPDHLADEVFSELVDGQLAPDEVSLAQAHLGTCADCQARLAEMEALVGLLRSLPSVEPPRDFRIGPRLVADPPNVVRLRRWYTWTRAGAGALAAAFVFLSVGTLYVDSRPAGTSAVLSSKAQPAAENAPAPAAQSAPGAAASDAAATVAVAVPSPAARAAAPAFAPPPPAAAGAAARSQAAPAPTSTETGDQIAAATTVRPLPTQVPTPLLLAQPTAAVASPPVTPPQQTDPAAPLRAAAALVGVLAAFGILLALLFRHRLQAASPSHLE